MGNARRHSEDVRERGPELEWSTDVASLRHLERRGFHVLSYAGLRADFVEPARAPERRPSLASPAARLFELLDQTPRVAVIGVPTGTAGDLHDIYGYLVEPAWRRGVHLRIHADRSLADLRPEDFVEPAFGYAWTLERLRYIADRAARRDFGPGLPPLTPIEHRLLQSMREEGLSPAAQYGVDRFRVDFAFPSIQLVVEADGREWHDPERDRRRDAALAALGWSVVRFTGSEIVRDTRACAVTVAERCRQLESVPRYTALTSGGDTRGWLRRMLARLRAWLTSLARPPAPTANADPLTLAEEPPPPSVWLRELDESQFASVQAHDGVVQVLAPAGSGKTRVLVARVQELISRGVPPNRILCCTFNREAKDELARRLREQGVEHVATRSFHGIGWQILKEAGLLRKDVATITFPQWRYLAKRAKDAHNDGVWIDADVAVEVISRFKLIDLVTPAEARVALRRKSKVTPLESTAVELYRLYEILLEENELLDFDDLIMRSLRLLMEDETARRRWQRQFLCILVDEYQDIEPAQERLIQILAAPHDSLFCVGDEDQCIYAWRRAEVERILRLDRQYPGLERHALDTNYRCPSQVTNGSRHMIEQNAQRFPKAIHAREGAHPGEVEIACFESGGDIGPHTAQLLAVAESSKTVVLSRTRQVLRDVAVACARAGVHFKAGDFILDRSGPNRTLTAYLHLLTDPITAGVEDIGRAFRVPNRYLPESAVALLASRLHAGASFNEAVKGLGGSDAWRQTALDKAAVMFDRLAQIKSADDLIDALRADGGLDNYYALAQKLNPNDQSAIDALDAARQRAVGMTARQFAALYTEETDLIRRYRSDDGVELSTIHGAKGREWPWVILVNADDETLPHKKSIESGAEGDARAAAVEDERRLTYVAITRAKARLTILHHSRLSPFIEEALPGFSDVRLSVVGHDAADSVAAA